MKSNKQQHMIFIKESIIFLIIGLAFFSILFLIGNLITNKVLDVSISNIIPQPILFTFIGSYLLASIMFGIETTETYLKKQSKKTRILAWILFPIVYLLAILFGILAFIPVFIYHLVQAF